MSGSGEVSALAAALQRIEQRLTALSSRIGFVEDQVGIVDLKLEALDSIWKATRQIAAAVGANDGGRARSDG